MSKLNDLTAILNEDVEQLNAAHELIVAKITALYDAISNANPDLPAEVQTALDDLQASIQHEAELGANT